MVTPDGRPVADQLTGAAPVVVNVVGDFTGRPSVSSGNVGMVMTGAL